MAAWRAEADGMEMEKALTRLKALQAKLHAYEHAENIIYYDSVTAAPSDTDEGRGETLGVLTGEAYASSADSVTAAPADTERSALPEKRLLYSDAELRNAFCAGATLFRGGIREYQKLVNSAQHVWQPGRKRKTIFPPLRRISNA